MCVLLSPHASSLLSACRSPPPPLLARWPPTSHLLPGTLGPLPQVPRPGERTAPTQLASGSQFGLRACPGLQPYLRAGWASGAIFWCSWVPRVLWAVDIHCPGGNQVRERGQLSLLELQLGRTKIGPMSLEAENSWSLVLGSTKGKFSTMCSVTPSSPAGVKGMASD